MVTASAINASTINRYDPRSYLDGSMQHACTPAVNAVAPPAPPLLMLWQLVSCLLMAARPPARPLALAREVLMLSWHVCIG